MGTVAFDAGRRATAAASRWRPAGAGGGVEPRRQESGVGEQQAEADAARRRAKSATNVKRATGLRHSSSCPIEMESEMN